MTKKMNYVQEFFVSRYIISSKQDRLLYEINSKKKKEKFINHFCHDTLSFIIPDKIVFRGNVYDSFNFIKNENNFFVISFDFIDGKKMEKADLLKYMENEYLAIVAISDSCAIIKEEHDDNSHVFVLKSSK